MIFSTVPFSAIPFSDSGQQRRAYFEAEFFGEASFEFVIYVGTAAGYATLPTDTLASQPFRAVLQSYTFTRSILGSDIGTFTTGTGTLIINNRDAFYDFLPRDYTMDARPIFLRATRFDGSYDAAFTIANVTSTGWTIDTDQVALDLRDYGYKLDVPMQPNVYLGTGGKEGGADLTNKRKPLGFGSPHEISPPLVDTALLTYQVHDGSIQAVTGVYDEGVSLSFVRNYASYALMAAADLSADDGYVTCLAEGFIRLTDLPDKLTCDIQGDNSDGYISTSADIVRWAIRNRTVLVDPDGLYVPSFDAVNSSRPAPIEYWIGPDDSLTVADFVANVMGGILGWGGQRRDGLFEVRVFAAPTGNPVASFSRKDIIGDDIKREPLPSNYNPPPWRWRVPYQRAYTVQTLTTDISADRKAFLAQDVRLGGAKDDAIKIDHPFAVDPDPIQAYFKNKSDADDEGGRRIALFKTTRAMYRFSVDRKGFLRGLGDEIEMTHERFDLSQGRSMIICQLTETITFGDESIETVEVVAYG
jgi:hypothetical protein